MNRRLVRSVRRATPDRPGAAPGSPPVCGHTADGMRIGAGQGSRAIRGRHRHPSRVGKRGEHHMTADAHDCSRPGFGPLLRRSAQHGALGKPTTWTPTGKASCTILILTWQVRSSCSRNLRQSALNEEASCGLR